MTHSTAARYDAALGAWILSSYADVSVALRDPRLSLTGARLESADAQVMLRDAASHALSAQQLAGWRTTMEHSAAACAAALPAAQRVDLVESFARPWSIEVAAIVSGATRSESARLAVLAREVFLAAAAATSSDPQPDTHGAVVELSRSLRGPDPMIAVQAFVALTQTLPCVLAGAWRALMRHPEVMERVRSTPRLMPQAVDELLRLTSITRAAFRRASADTQIGTASIAAGDRVVLMIALANHDPAQFADPLRLDLARDTRGHLAFGLGMHPCVGAALVRLAVTTATSALLNGTSQIELAGEAEWLEGFAISAHMSLPVVVRRRRSCL